MVRDPPTCFRRFRVRPSKPRPPQPPQAAILDLKHSLDRSPRWSRQRSSRGRLETAPAKPAPTAAPAPPCADWRRLPSALAGVGALADAGAKRVVVFLDYDGTRSGVASDRGDAPT